MKLEMLVSEKLGKAISESSNQEIYQALMAVVWHPQNRPASFLIPREHSKARQKKPAQSDI